MLLAAALLAAWQGKHPQPLIRLGGTTSGVFVCMAAVCIISGTALFSLRPWEFCFLVCVMISFTCRLVFIKQCLLLWKRSSKGLKNYTKWPLCNCILQLSNERWYALDIHFNVDSVVNHSTQKCRQCYLNFNVDWTLLLRWELCGWCDRWLMGHCTPVMGWSVNIKCHLLQKIITLSSKDSYHKNIKSIIEKHYLFKYNSTM